MTRIDYDYSGKMECNLKSGLYKIDCSYFLHKQAPPRGLNRIRSSKYIRLKDPFARLENNLEFRSKDLK